MSRIGTLLGIAAVTLGAFAPSTNAETTDAVTGGEVRALSIVPAGGRAEVVIAVDGSVDVQDFALSGPARIVLDLARARFTGSAKLYDKVPRGGITNIRVAQYREDVVRVVIELDSDHKYTITPRRRCAASSRWTARPAARSAPGTPAPPSPPPRTPARRTTVP